MQFVTDATAALIEDSAPYGEPGARGRTHTPPELLTHPRRLAPWSAALLVIDSVMALFRVDFVGRGELAERQQKLNKHLNQIKKRAWRGSARSTDLTRREAVWAAVAEEFNLAVVLTNQGTWHCARFAAVLDSQTDLHIFSWMQSRRTPGRAPRYDVGGLASAVPSRSLLSFVSCAVRCGREEARRRPHPRACEVRAQPPRALVRRSKPAARVCVCVRAQHDAPVHAQGEREQPHLVRRTALAARSGTRKSA